jgi:nitrile hydratase subunit beta
VNGVHDLGGTDGLGRVIVPDSEPVFRADWEKAAFAMFSMCFRAGYFGVDEFRYGIEQMHPAVYLLSPYYEHWVHTVEHYGQAKGLLDPDDRDPDAEPWSYYEHWLTALETVLAGSGLLSESMLDERTKVVLATPA